MPTLEIALATHNSSRFLPEQLDSLFEQTCQDFTILVADDGSTDTTRLVLVDFQRRHPGRIQVLEFDEPARGPSGNFARLIDRVTADYVMFCDHDDVWLPDKIALTLERMQSMEATHGGATPLLVHTDLIVAGPALERLHPSYWQYVKLNPARNTLGQMLVQITVTGCTILMNRALYELARPVSFQVCMHDSWCALVAAAFGKIDYIDKGTILYRQHDNNVYGAKPWNISHILQRAWQTLFDANNTRYLTAQTLAAKALLARHGSKMTAEQRDVTATMADLWLLPRRARFLRMWRTGLTKDGILRNIAQLVTVSTRDAHEFHQLGKR